MRSISFPFPPNSEGTFYTLTQREAQQANELSNLTRKWQLLASVNYRRAIIEDIECLLENLVAYKTREHLKRIQKAVLVEVIELKKELHLQLLDIIDERRSFLKELEQYLPTNVMAYKTWQELKGLQKDDMIRAMEMSSTALQLHHQAMKGCFVYKLHCLTMIVQIWARSGFDEIEEFLRCLRDRQELYTTFSTLAGKLWGRGRSWVFDLNKFDLCPSFVKGLTAKGLRPSRGGFPCWLKGEAFELERRVCHQAPQSNVMYASMDALHSTHQMLYKS
ncbi:hypothetical protein Tco_0439920 [Tanacetum coccineum]